MGARDAVAAMAESVAATLGLVVLETGVAGIAGRAQVRIVIHRPPGGPSIDDLTAFHRAVAPLLEQIEAVGVDPAVEVQSPGLERPLRTQREFDLFAGRAVRLATRVPVDGRREWDGRILGQDADGVRIAFGPRGAERVAIPWAEVAWARLRIEER